MRVSGGEEGRGGEGDFVGFEELCVPSENIRATLIIIVIIL